MVEKIPGYCALCISRCGCMSQVKDGKLIAVGPLPGHPTGKTLCIKGRAAPEMVYSPDRVLTPLKRTNPKSDPNPGWQQISWDEALTISVNKIRAASREIGPEAVCFGVTTPSGTGISDSFVHINRLAHAFGSPNTLFATENCNWHKDFTPGYTFGNTIGMPDYKSSGCIILWGFNPTTSWLAQAELINQAVKRGAKLVVIDPRKVGFANKADEWLRVRPATDGPLAMALSHQLISQNLYDKHFIQHWSNGTLLVDAESGELIKANELNLNFAVEPTHNSYLAWDAVQNMVVVYDADSAKYRAPDSHPFEDAKTELSTTPLNCDNLALFGSFHIVTNRGVIKVKPAFQLYAAECSKYSPEVAEAITAIPAQQIIATAQLIASSAPVSYFTWTGTAQQQEATQTSRAMALLYALTGDLDKQGGNVYFTKPPIANQFGLDLLADDQRSKTLGNSERPLGPATMGWISSKDLHRTITEGEPYQTKALVSFGGNPLLTKPNADDASQVLKQLDFYLHIDMFHNATSQYADIILPAASPWERPGFYPGFQVSQQAESFIQLRPAVISPIGDSKSDSWIVFELAKRLQLEDRMFDGDPDRALAKLLAPMGLGDDLLDKLKSHPEGIATPQTTIYQKYSSDGFATPTKKLEIFSTGFQHHGYSPIPQFAAIESKHNNGSPGIDTDHLEFPLYLISAKEVAYCHSQQRELPSLKKRRSEPLVEIALKTAAEYGISAGDWVLIETHMGAIQARAKISGSLGDETICCQYGWHDDANGKSWNYSKLITDLAFDPISGSNLLRNSRCRISKV